MTISFLNGRLDFKKRNDWNSTKEDVILWHTEQELLADIYLVRTLKEAIASTFLAQHKPQAIFLPDQSFNAYTRFKLPSLVKSSKISKGGDKKLTKKDADDIKHLVQQAIINKNNK